MDLLKQAFFLHGTQSVRADFDFNFFTTNGKSFGLQIRLPYFLGMALRKAHIVAVLLSFFIKIKSLHNSRSNSSGYKG
jgi:hypothetical protein